MTTRAVIERYIEASNGSDWPVLARLLHDDLVHDRADGAREIGHEAFREHLAARRARLRMTIADAEILVSESGLRAGAEFVLRGEGPDGRSFAVPAGEFYEVEDGRIARISTYANARLSAALAETG